MSESPLFSELLSLVEPDLLDRSGTIFHSGRPAFEQPSPIYLLGLNPGGAKDLHAGLTVRQDLEFHRANHDAWSAYSDQEWGNHQAGQHPYQRSVLHMLGQCSLDPRSVPASNVIFTRTVDEASIDPAEKEYLLRACWPVHQRVIDALQPRAVVCLGGTAGQWVREQTGARTQVDEYIEDNERGWRSVAHQNSDGLHVVTLTHPSRANWTNPLADPTRLVRSALARAK